MIAGPEESRRGDKKTAAPADAETGLWGRLDDLLHRLLGANYPKGTKLREWIWNETVQTVVYAFAIAIVVRVVAFEPFNIPSGSMYPNLMVGDYLFVSKYPYGYSRHSFPFSFPPFDGRIIEGAAERGDVAVFKEPRQNETDFIKRVIGLPGDRIQMIGGVLHINGEPVKRERIEDYPLPDNYGRTTLVRQYTETLPDGSSHRIIETNGDVGYNDNTRVYNVPAEHYFMMGDNRDNSSDSRVIGPVPAMNMVGRAEILFFSTDGSARLWEFWRWPFATRYSRLFDSVE